MVVFILRVMTVAAACRASAQDGKREPEQISIDLIEISNPVDHLEGDIIRENSLPRVAVLDQVFPSGGKVRAHRVRDRRPRAAELRGLCQPRAARPQRH